MRDQEIIEHLFRRDEEGLNGMQEKYERYLWTIAFNILGIPEDAEESVNVVWMSAWNRIPPERPEILSAYLAKITRYISLKRLRESRAAKRGGGQGALVLEELAECVSDGRDVEETVERRALTESVNTFLRALPEGERRVFICRYWYFDGVADIAARFGFSQSKVKSMLFRTRGKLAAHLKKEGFADEEG